MRQYILKRALLIIPTLLLVTILVFSLLRILPGQIVELMITEQGYGKDADLLRESLGLTKPIHIQYLEWLPKVLTGNFGDSLWTGRPIAEELLLRLPVSLELGAMTLFIAISLGVPIGIISALKQDTRLDYTIRSLSIAGLSIPSFWIATMVIVLPNMWFNWMPQFRFVPFATDPVKNLEQFILPAAVGGLASSASLMRLTRSMMLEVLRQDYIRTAWAKGLAQRVIIYRHALRNAMIPIVTVLGISIVNMLGGQVIMEQIFVLPGVGRYMLQAVTMRDYPVVQFVNLFLATAMVCMNLAVDILYGYLDPRIRYQ